jgi:hypothetical protein
MEHFNTSPSKSFFRSSKMSQYLTGYFHIKKTNRTLIDILLWWESKRFFFNFVLLVLNYIFYKLTYLFNHTNEIALFNKRNLSLFLLVNILYSLSCVYEFILPSNTKYAPIAYKKGLLLSLGIFVLQYTAVSFY